LLRVPVPGGHFEANEGLRKKKNARKTTLLCDAGCIVLKKLVGEGGGAGFKSCVRNFPESTRRHGDEMF